MAITENTYTGDGATVLFSFTFEYIAESDIKITLDGTPTTAYTLANATTIQFNTAPANGVDIRIYRDTNIDTLSAEFFPGSAIKAEDLNTNFTQNLYVTQEVNNNAVQSDDSTPFVNDISMGGYKITNLADPVASGDAATRNFVENALSSEIPVFYRRWSKTAAGGETSLSGNDDNGISLSYVAGSEKVFINGALQVRGVDYTGTTGTTLTGIPALTAGDVVEVHSSSNYTVATVPDGSVTNAKVDGGAAIQSTKLAFIQSGTSATTRTVESKLRDVVSVKDFGAVGDGTTDDTAAIQNAVQAAAGKTLVFPAGIYKTNSFDVPSNTTLTGYGATLDFSSFAKSSRIKLTGSTGSGVVISVNATAGSSSISVASSSGFAVGDLVLVSSDAFVPAGAYGDSTETIGELQVIKSIAGASITFENVLRDTYNVADNVIIAKLTPNTNSSLQGFSILGSGTLGTGASSTEIGIRATYAQNLVIRDVSVDLCDYQAISIDTAYNVCIENCKIFNEDPLGQDIIQYGIALKGATDNILISGNTILGCKHGIAWTENSKPGVSYGCSIVNNFISGTWAAAIATHETTSDFVISNNNLNSVIRGLDIRVQNGRIVDNKILIKDPSESTADGIYLPLTPSNIIISNNYIDNSRFGVRMYNSGLSNGFKPSNIVIQNNYIKNASEKGIYLQQTQNAGPFTGFVIKGNTILSSGGDFINLDGEFADAVISNNLLDDPADTSVGFGVELQGTIRSIVSGNHSTNIIPVNLDADTQSVPEACSFAQILNNTYSGSGGLASTPNASNTKFSYNVRTDNKSVYVIASGAIALSIGETVVRVDTEASAASDDLDTINGGNIGDMVSFYSLSNFRDITFKDGTGNLQLAGDFTLSDTDDVILLLRTASGWQEISRSNNT